MTWSLNLGHLNPKLSVLTLPRANFAPSVCFCSIGLAGEAVRERRIDVNSEGSSLIVHVRSALLFRVKNNLTQ